MSERERARGREQERDRVDELHMNLIYPFSSGGRRHCCRCSFRKISRECLSRLSNNELKLPKSIVIVFEKLVNILCVAIINFESRNFAKALSSKSFAVCALVCVTVCGFCC